MAITTDDVILKFGTQDEQTTGTPSTVTNDAFSDNNDTITSWTNDDDSPLGGAVLKIQFDTTMPTVGSVGLYAKMFDVQSTNDVPDPDANFEHLYVGTFPIDFGQSADTDFYTVIPMFQMPMLASSQGIQWFLKNQGTSQTIGVSWQLWITPVTHGPHA